MECCSSAFIDDVAKALVHHVLPQRWERQMEQARGEAWGWGGWVGGAGKGGARQAPTSFAQCQCQPCLVIGATAYL